jgi:hypothetical protein
MHVTWLGPTQYPADSMASIQSSTNRLKHSNYINQSVDCFSPQIKKGKAGLFPLRSREWILAEDFVLDPGARFAIMRTNIGQKPKIHTQSRAQRRSLQTCPGTTQRELCPSEMNLGFGLQTTSCSDPGCTPDTVQVLAAETQVHTT